MRRRIEVLLFVVACGGATNEVGTDASSADGSSKEKKSCPQNPFNAGCSAKDECIETFSFCGGTAMVTCTCDNQGHFQCPDVGGGGCPNRCAQYGDIGPNDGFGCHDEGLMCPAAVLDACGQPQTCTCTSGQWKCPTPTCSDGGSDAASDAKTD